MNIRTKLTLIFSSVFIVVLAVGGLGSYYLRWLSEDTEAIIQDNYRTLTYMQQLDDIMDKIVEYTIIPAAPNAKTELNDLLQQGREVLVLQEANVTEMGEGKMTDRLVDIYEQLSSELTSSADQSPPDNYRSELLPLLLEINAQITRIYEMNEDALLQKNEQALQTSNKVVLYMGILVACSLILGIFFIYGFPKVLTRPIQDFNWAVRELSLGNYKVKIPVKNYDELGDLARAFNGMAAKLQEYKENNMASLLFEKKRLDAVINQMHEAIIGLDESKHVIFVNDRMLNLLNISKREDIIGRYAPDIAVQNELLKDLIRELMVGAETWETEKISQFKAVEEQTQKLFAKHVLDVVDEPTGEDRRVLIGHVVLLTDITEFAEKDTAKTQFIATLSHELKTPTAAIKMCSELLSNNKVGNLNQEQSSLLGTIADNTGRIQHIINEVLDISKIESGAIDIHKVEVDPAQIIDKAIDGVRLFLKDKNLQIEKNLDTPLQQIRVDPHKTVWILNNFLTNAIRYAPDNSSILVAAIKTNGFLKICVTDKGPGIPAQHQQRIFEKFSRVPDHNNDEEGTGLGLAISSEFVKAMFGEIGVDAEPGEGSTFWVRFPTVQDENRLYKELE
jgi:signal transduction histidine kinase